MVKKILQDNRSSIGWKLLKYLMFFVVGVLVLLWTVQVVFLGDIYQFIKTQEIKTMAQTVQTRYNQSGLDGLRNTDTNRDTHFRVIDHQGNVVLDFSGIAKPFIQNITKQVYLDLYNLEGIDKGLLLQLKEREGRNEPLSLTYAIALGDDYLAVIQSQIIPVNATVQTIRFQLIAVSVLCVLVASFLAWYIYKRISKPIIAINDRAKSLAGGDYTRAFETKGYKEIEELSQTLETMRHDLQRVEALRNELLANVSHDLRTPLTMIGGYAELMRDIPDEMNRDNLAVIINETQDLSIMIQDMLDLAKVEKGLEQLDVETFDVVALCDGVIKRLNRSYANRVITQHAKGVLMVLADRGKIQQVLYNLIQNGLSHSQGEISIRLTTHNDAVRVEVESEGNRIPEADLERIWTRYYQSNQDHQRGAYGSGLGLSIVRNIFDLHQLRYGVVNNDVGVLFWFELTKS